MKSDDIYKDVYDRSEDPAYDDMATPRTTTFPNFPGAPFREDSETQSRSSSSAALRCYEGLGLEMYDTSARESGETPYAAAEQQAEVPVGFARAQ